MRASRGQYGTNICPLAAIVIVLCEVADQIYRGGEDQSVRQAASAPRAEACVHRLKIRSRRLSHFLGA